MSFERNFASLNRQLCVISAKKTKAIARKAHELERSFPELHPNGALCSPLAFKKIWKIPPKNQAFDTCAMGTQHSELSMEKPEGSSS